MSDSPQSLDEQIAVLEQALRLPLPDATRVQIEQDLAKLRALKLAPREGVHGATEVSGTMYGNAIGVNLGTVQAYFGAQPPAPPGAQPPAQVSREQIDDQRELLATHRRTLAIYLKQRAALGGAYAPPGIEHGIREARAAIQRIKQTLRGWNVAAADHPDDEEQR